ncbi:helix-turn-helix domain-containing protein [Agrobacterium rhizogenes]|nr:helix-turn-helix domain-containing protein [Rhizobium rhizogenes]
MSSEATIRRGARNARYTAVPNIIFEDDRLSMEARWLLGYLLSKPDNWIVVIGDIIKKGKCGRDKARKMIAELVEFGYAEREQSREDGKFGASNMVIFDEPRTAAEHEAAGESGESVAFLPQTEMPSPAKPSPVLPSPAKSAHSNNSSLANTDYQQEREARDEGSEEKPEAVERAFRRWYAKWPTRDKDSEYAGRKAWQKLSPDQRTDCIAKSPTYIERAEKAKISVPWAGAYLTGRDWEKLEDPKSDVALPAVHGPYTRAWHAGRCAELLKPASATMPALPPLLRSLVAEGGERAEAILRDRRVKHGWPKVNTMDERVQDRKGMTVAPNVFRISEGFDSVGRNGALCSAWERFFARTGLPWLPLPAGNVERFFFPPVSSEITDLDAAVSDAWSAFERQVNEGISNDA